ncbi:MAG: glycosyltransferase, partial [Planctomycetota bacterium]
MMRPRFTVIVPSYARPDRLLVCLRAVDALSYDGYDVVVSDDGSPDPLEPLVARERWQHDVGVVRGPNRGSGAARNRAAAEALGSRLAFTADDCAP